MVLAGENTDDPEPMEGRLFNPAPNFINCRLIQHVCLSHDQSVCLIYPQLNLLFLCCAPVIISYELYFRETDHLTILSIQKEKKSAKGKSADFHLLKHTSNINKPFR